MDEIILNTSGVYCNVIFLTEAEKNVLLKNTHVHVDKASD